MSARVKATFLIVAAGLLILAGVKLCGAVESLGQKISINRSAVMGR